MNPNRRLTLSLTPEEYKTLHELLTIDLEYLSKLPEGAMNDTSKRRLAFCEKLTKQMKKD